MKNKLYIICGIPFSGKTTLANKLAKVVKGVHIDLDQVKFNIFGKGITDKQIDQAGWDKVYQKIYQQIEIALRQGKTVVYDTGNFTIYERSLINNIAKKLNLPFKTIYVDTPVEIARERLEKNRKKLKRFDISDQLFKTAVKEMQLPRDSEKCILFKNTDDFDTWFTQNF